MKPTIKVSIGGFAFNLEEDAYRVLNNYLQALRNHFQGNPESDEIIADIEARLSELLLMRMSKNEGAVSLEDAQEIIKIMGNPKDFDDSASSTSTTGNPTENSTENFLRKKRLYRDIENKVIGGVCSGLGHYFRIDAAVIRLLFAGLFLFLFFFRNSGPSCLVVVGVYIILWIVMPAARTFNQKLVMTGAEPSIENIEDRTQIPVRKYRGGGITTFFNVLLNIIVGIIAFFTFLFLIAIIGSLAWIYLDTDILATANYMSLFGYNTFYFKTAILLVSIIPVIGLFWLMIKVLRRSSFTTATLISFIIGLVVWLGSAFYIGNKTTKFVYSHRERGEAIETIPVNTQSNRLYVKLGSEYSEADSQPNNPILLYKGEKQKYRSITVLPNMRIREDTTLTTYKIEVCKHNFGENNITAKRKAENMHLDYNITDSLLVLNPKWYNNDKPWNLEMYEIIITAPKGKDVELITPLNDNYRIGNVRIGRWGYYDSDYNRFEYDFWD